MYLHHTKFGYTHPTLEDAMIRTSQNTWNHRVPIIIIIIIICVKFLNLNFYMWLLSVDQHKQKFKNINFNIDTNYL